MNEHIASERHGRVFDRDAMRGPQSSAEATHKACIDCTRTISIAAAQGDVHTGLNQQGSQSPTNEHVAPQPNMIAYQPCTTKRSRMCR